MEPIRFACPHCTARISAPPRRAGTRGKCPSCDAMVQIPAQSQLGAAGPEDQAKGGTEAGSTVQITRFSESSASQIAATPVPPPRGNLRQAVTLYRPLARLQEEQRRAFRRKCQAIRLWAQNCRADRALGILLCAHCRGLGVLPNR